MRWRNGSVMQPTYVERWDEMSGHQNKRKTFVVVPTTHPTNIFGRSRGRRRLPRRPASKAKLGEPGERGRRGVMAPQQNNRRTFVAVATAHSTSMNAEISRSATIVPPACEQNKACHCANHERRTGTRGEGSKAPAAALTARALR